MTNNDNPSKQGHCIHDVIVIGAGVVGCAVARRFATQGAHVLVVEKAADMLDGASKGNSAILHTGFDAPVDSIEHSCIAEGYREYLEIHERFDLPLLKTGALVLARNEEQLEKLDRIVTQAHTNGVTDVCILEADEVYRMESGIGSGVLAAVHVPGESLIDPWSTPYAYLLQAIDHGAEFLNQCEVTGGKFDGESWTLQTSRTTLKAKWVINCAGLFGDVLHRQLIEESPFAIRPRKGQFLVFDKSAASLTSTILLPVPTETTKGIVVCPTVFGNLLVGPTAEEQESRDNRDVDRQSLVDLKQVGESILPELRLHQVTATYSGLRPASQFKEYQVITRPQQNYLCLGGIRSTGLSAALGIARMAWREFSGEESTGYELAPTKWPKVPRISECSDRDWKHSGHGGIVCHCELVTRREIKQALQGPLAAKTLSGLKRRTRITMGRCQGFYCSAELSKLTDGYLDPPLGETIGNDYS